MQGGWIKIYRKLMDNPLWLSHEFTPGQAWADLLMMANHAPGFIIVRGIKVTVKRGQVGWSVASMGARWKWGRGKVKRFLNMLESEQQIEQQINNVTTLITITNYCPHQDDPTADRQQTDSRQTADGQQTDTNKNDKKNKNEEKGEDIPPDALRLSALLADLIKKNIPQYKELRNGNAQTTINRWSVDIDKMHRLDDRSWTDIERIVKWCQADSFWHKNILSGKTLRDKFDRLWADAADGKGGTHATGKGPRIKAPGYD